MTESQTASQSHNGTVNGQARFRNSTTFREYLSLPEVNKATINIYGSTEGIKKETKRVCEQKTLVIHPYSSFRKYWLVLVILATFGNVVAIPLSVSFFTETVHYSPAWISLNVIIDVLFIMDLCLNFRIGYSDDDTEEVVLDSVKIKKHYLKTWFIPDLVAVMPVDYFLVISWALGHHTNTSGLAGVRVVKLVKLARLFSLLRLLRFSRLLRYAQNWEEVHGWNVGGIATFLQFLHMVVIIVLICHWSACFHFMVATIQDFPDNSWITHEGLQNKSMTIQYTRCMFRSLCHMMTLNYGSPGVPHGTTQLWVDIMSMMVGTVMYALILARITALVTHSRASENVYKHKYNEMCQYMRQYRCLSGDLRRRALGHLSSRYQGKWFDEQSILMELNEPLRREVISYNCKHLIEQHPIFKDASDFFLIEVLDMLEFECYQPGDMIIWKGAIGDCMFFIERGDVLVEMPGFTETLSDGSFFGELCVVTDTTRRQANVRALTLCRLYSLSNNNYRKVLERFPEHLHRIDTVAQERLRNLPGQMPIVQNSNYLEWSEKLAIDVDYDVPTKSKHKE